MDGVAVLYVVSSSMCNPKPRMAPFSMSAESVLFICPSSFPSSRRQLLVYHCRLLHSFRDSHRPDMPSPISSSSPSIMISSKKVTS